ncbi:MAG: pirin family protein [Acidimicrobiia bacterium]|nr:pirin family protein [Acidimicrobiia bacterium]
METTSTSTVLGMISLGPQWQTLDPFLFCAHHVDDYPQGDGTMAPDASLSGREIGSDFSGTDGWSMYHGSSVPGFPQHPHRGFETITFARRGVIDHSDSLGATARFSSGDVQWMTAGSGIVHSEMFPLVNTDADNPLELFQVWLNLPAVDKLVDPYFTMLWSENIPRLELPDGGQVTIIAGRLGDVDPPTPPPNSWAARDESDLAIWHITLPAGSKWTVPVNDPASSRVLYQFAGAGLTIGDQRLPARTGAQVRSGIEIEIAATDEAVEVLLLQGAPIGEPVAKYGPFVMNTREEIEQAFADYQETQFGGWPWPTDGPVHPATDDRFAVHANGEREDAPSTS